MMRYDERDRQSGNVEDRRGRGGGRFRMPGGRGFRVPMGRKGGISITTLLIIGAIMLYFGMNPLDLLTGGNGGRVSGPGRTISHDAPAMPTERGGVRRSTGDRSPFEIPGLPGSKPSKTSTAPDDKKVFVSRVLADNEDIWNRVFKSFGKDYREPKLVLFEGYTQTACGTGQRAMGPFYCPSDEKIYIDLAFYQQLARQFNAPGDFAQAYVISHEVGHHVQKLLGIAEWVQRSKRRLNKSEQNGLQVRMELQADCLAGVWANLNDSLKSRLQRGDIEEALNAASQIGDDTIQRRQTGYVRPHEFTHGSSKQRMRWFRKGFDTGKMQACETFKIKQSQL